MVTAEVVSGVKSVQAQDGTSFDIMRGVPDEVVQARGNALVKMRAIVQAREPENLPNLSTDSLSSEYAMSAAISHSKIPAVKADLVRISVEEHLTEGHRASAVNVLSYAEATYLPLPEYGQEFVSQQYEAALVENNPRDAWSIARTMSERNRILAAEPQTAEEQAQDQEWDEQDKRDFKLYVEDALVRNATVDDVMEDLYVWREGYDAKLTERDDALEAKPQAIERQSRQRADREKWTDRERKAFTLYAEDTLARNATAQDVMDDVDLMFVFDAMRYRKDVGFNTDDTLELARNVAERMIERDMATGRERIALQHAVEAKMSDDYISKLKRRIPRKALEQARDLWNSIKDRYEQIVDFVDPKYY